MKNAHLKRLVTSTQRPEVDFAAYSKHPIFGPMATPCETPAYVKQVKVELDFLGLAKTLLHSESPTVNQGFGPCVDGSEIPRPTTVWRDVQKPCK